MFFSLEPFFPDFFLNLMINLRSTYLISFSCIYQPSPLTCYQLNIKYCGCAFLLLDKKWKRPCIFYIIEYIDIFYSIDLFALLGLPG